MAEKTEIYEGKETGTGKLYEFFTPEKVVEKMWLLARKYGFTHGNILEPAAGSGRLLDGAKPNDKITAFEITEENYKTLKDRFPAEEIIHNRFEVAFLEEPRYNKRIKSKTTPTWLRNYPFDLVIANPPYGAFSGTYKTFFNFSGQYEHFFMLMCLDLLKVGGLAVYLVPSSFMRNGISYNKVKEQMFEKATLLDAYRLPTSIFAKTQIGTDLIILKKK
jgi:type I restriction-modification system DNA methylase subunit